MTKREKVCIIIISVVLAILIGAMMSLAGAHAAPGCPPTPTPTQPNAVTLVEFNTVGFDTVILVAGHIAGLVLVVICIGVLIDVCRKE